MDVVDKGKHSKIVSRIYPSSTLVCSLRYHRTQFRTPYSHLYGYFRQFNRIQTVRFGVITATTMISHKAVCPHFSTVAVRCLFFVKHEGSRLWAAGSCEQGNELSGSIHIVLFVVYLIPPSVAHIIYSRLAG
jgi:hypothetical protein